MHPMRWPLGPVAWNPDQSLTQPTNRDTLPAIPPVAHARGSHECTGRGCGSSPDRAPALRRTRAAKAVRASRAAGPPGTQNHLGCLIKGIVLGSRFLEVRRRGCVVRQVLSERALGAGLSSVPSAKADCGMFLWPPTPHSLRGYILLSPAATPNGA